MGHAGKMKAARRVKPGKKKSAAKVTVFVATSLDGFIARENGALDWLPAPAEADAEDYGYKALMDRVDALVMGRATFEKVLTFGAWPYGKKPVVVLTRGSLRIPKGIEGRVEVMRGTPAEIVEALAQRGRLRLYLDGGRTIQGFLEAGWVDEIIITRVPVLLGRGIPLFGPLRQGIRLHHVETRPFASGLVQSTYEVTKDSRARA